MNSLIIIGASGHGKVILDIALKNGYQDIKFLDDSTDKQECAGYPIIDSIKNAYKYIDFDFIIAIGNNKTRKKIYNTLSNHRFISLVHPSAIISRRVSIGLGTVVMANAVINSDTRVGDFCIVNTSSSIDHDCTIENFSHISVGSHIAGNVSIGSNSWIGVGAIVSNNIKMFNNVLIGAGSTVIRDIDSQGTYIETPSKKL